MDWLSLGVMMMMLSVSSLGHKAVGALSRRSETYSRQSLGMMMMMMMMSVSSVGHKAVGALFSRSETYSCLSLGVLTTTVYAGCRTLYWLTDAYDIRSRRDTR
jgi:uncharacterized membrane protein YcjF (UPF0283 family)